jgi:hypothetical protein
MSKKLAFSMVLNVALMGLLVAQEIRNRLPKGLPNAPVSREASPKGPCPGPGICGTNAVTLDKRADIVGDGQFHPTGFNLQVYKTQKNSFLFYTCQITFQFDIPQSVGAHFKMRVKDSSGKYIMPDMMTGEVSNAANAYQSAMLSDTVYHMGTNFDPPAGLYTFELWALAGAGTLTIVPFMSNITVLELPR